MEAFLNEHYGLSGCTFKKLVGYISTNYRVDCSQGTYLLKVYPYSESELVQLEAEIAMIKCLDHLDRQSVSTPIPNQQGHDLTITEDKIYRLMSFVEGQFLSEASPSPALYESLGRFMGKVDQKLEGFRDIAIESRSLDWDLNNLPRIEGLIQHIASVEDQKLVRHFYLQWQVHVQPQLEKLRKCIIHNDANDWNVLTKDDRVNGIIDFGDATYTSLINELAICLAYALFDKDEPLKWAEYIVKGYHQEQPLLKQELDLLYYLVAGRLVTSLCFSSYDIKQQPDNEYIVISQRPALDLLRKWARINPIKAKAVFYKAAGFQPAKTPAIEQVKAGRHKVMSPQLSLSYQTPIHMDGAAFQYMYDAQGNTFLDAYNNIPHVGHQHPRVVEAGRRQMAQLNTNTRYLFDQLEAYASKLLAKFPAPLSKVYFVNSGSAASDLAVRLAQNYTGQHRMMVIEHGYHGNTRMGIDISHYKYTSRGGKGKAEHIVEAPLPDVYRSSYKGPNAGSKYATEAMALVEEKALAAFIAEPIVGCGGQVPLAPGYLQALYPAIRSKGGLCISDEVQTGFGRMGTHFWGFEMHGITPDIVVLGKPMGNGHPMGAVVTNDAIAEAFDNGMEFFSSFGGNPVSCAIGEAVLDVLEEENLQANAQEVGQYYQQQLEALKKDFPEIGDVRGSGLFIGMELIKDDKLTPNTELASYLKNELRKQHILVSTDGPFDSVIKTKPPLCFNKANVDEVVNQIYSILKNK